MTDYITITDRQEGTMINYRLKPDEVKILK